MSAIKVCYPFPIIFPIIKIKHRSYRIHADSVRVILLNPIKRIGNQIIGNLRPSVIINQSSPMRMASFPWVLMLIKACSVKIRQSIRIPWEMCRNPIQNNPNTGFMHFIHKVHKVFIGSIPCRRRIISDNLISPGAIKRMLHYRHQFNMGISHFFHIINDKRSQLPVIQIALVFTLLKRPQIKLINANRLIASLPLLPALYPLLVFPYYLTGCLIFLFPYTFPYYGSRIRAELLPKSIRVCL